MSKTSLPSLYDEPAYRSIEAARMLALPLGTVKAWSFGQSYVFENGKAKRFHALITPADDGARLLSFNNLCELHLLAAIRRHYKIKMPAVRDGVTFIQKKLKNERPLLLSKFETNGIHLFIKHAGALLNVSREGQAASSEAFERDLSRVERNARGLPIRLFPTIRDTPASTPQSLSIVIDPQVAFGRPVLMQAGIRTEVIQDRFVAGDSPSEMAMDYRVSEPDILEALRFEHRLVA